MLTKIALVTALTIGAACAAMAAPDTEDRGGYRLLGPGGVVTDGVNPVYHPSMMRGESARGTAAGAYGFAPGAASCVQKSKKQPCS
jgi:hypothetical protein